MTRRAPPSRAEVIIVGGGPAGAAAAIALRRSGVGVLLLDRATFPRDKVCGDVLLPEAQETLRALGLDVGELEATAYLCTGVRYVSMSGPAVAGEFRSASGDVRPWWMIRRQTLDAWMLDSARQLGAEVLEGVGVDALIFGAEGEVEGVVARAGGGSSFEIRARVVIGADGASSVVARQVGTFARHPEHTCIAARAYVRGIRLPEPFLEVYTSPVGLPGCAWIAPVGPDEANVGIGIVLSTANRIGRTPQALFAEIRQQSPPFASRLADSDPIVLRGWSLPAATEKRRMAGAGWVLVGDAAGLVDPFTGHGIQNALTSGILAADAVGRAVAEPAEARKALSDYESSCRRELDGDVRRGAFLQRLHASPGMMRAVTEGCARHAGMRDTFVGLVGHSAPRSELLSMRALTRATARFRRSGVAA